MGQIQLLIAEDEAIIARDLQRRLEGQGYKVVSAVATGEDAVRKAETERPDLVLMDIVLLGDMDGIEAAGQIRARFDIPVVYVTAYADEKTLGRAKLTEPFGYILKPFDDRELRSTIEMALYKYEIENRLRVSNEFLRTVIESLSHPFYVINVADYSVVMANSAAGFGPLTSESKCYSLTHYAKRPCEGAEHPCTIAEIKRTQKPVQLEHIHYNHEGKASTFAICGYPIFDNDGGISRVIEYALDVSENKMLESQLRHSQKMESVGRLAGGVAHDFNNLLSAILGYSELALLKLPKEHPVTEYINIIAEAGQKAGTLVRQLMAFSRKQVLEIRVVNLNQLVDDILKILRLVIGEDLILEINLSPSLWNMKADAGQIEQVLMNLAVNARDAMPCGGRLTLETENVELDDEYASTHKGVEPGPYVMIAVTDTGTGMPHDIQEKIFEPFYSTKGSKGTGLGLATVYGIVRQHKGSIYVYSELGIGTTFKIYLPATAEREKADAGSEKLRSQDMRGTETILVVDDEPSILRLVKDTLGPLGYRLSDASCGEEALQRGKMMKDRLDLLVTDVVMTDMNGYELSEKMREEIPGLKVLFMSGYTDETIARFGIAGAGQKFIQKPLTPRKLASIVRDVLDEKRDA